MSSPISTSRDGPVLQLCLNRPDKLNAFSADLVDALHAAVLEAEGDETVRLVVFRGSGKGFSGGFDLAGLEEMSDGDLLLRFVRVEELLQAVYHAPFATMALVHGPCYGAAADLVAACQWRVCSPEARFRMPGLNFGIVLGTNRLSQLVGADQAHDLLARSKPFDAEEALRCGLVREIAGQQAWPTLQHRALSAAQALSPADYAAMTRRTRQSDREGDLAALVRSAAAGSIKQRISAYLASLAAKRSAKP